MPNAIEALKVGIEHQPYRRSSRWPRLGAGHFPVSMCILGITALEIMLCHHYGSSLKAEARAMESRGWVGRPAKFECRHHGMGGALDARKPAEIALFVGKRSGMLPANTI